MVQLSRESVLKWQKLFKEEYGKEFTYEEAYEAAHNLVGFFDLLLKIDMRNNPQKYIRKKDEKEERTKSNC